MSYVIKKSKNVTFELKVMVKKICYNHQQTLTASFPEIYLKNAFMHLGTRN